jgi:GNAT superfamily N-acetyltransferase
MSPTQDKVRLLPVIAPLREGELLDAERIFRRAFGTFLGAPDPDTFWADRDYVHGRWQAPHVAAFGASVEGHLVGSNFATRWGSVGFFGPLTVQPELHERGIAKALLAATVAQFDAWGTTQSGLFTFAQSAKHVALYQTFGFYPRFLTAIMALPARIAVPPAGTARFSTLSDDQKAEALRVARAVCETVYPGLDLSDEIATVDAQGMGDTLLLEGEGGVAGFAICHHGRRSEAGEGCCFVKFAAVRATAAAEADFAHLLAAAEALACSAAMPTLLAGVNLARQEAYQHMLARGFRTVVQGVTMHRHNEPGYCRPGVYVIDDWR